MMTLDKATELFRGRAGENTDFGANLLIEFDEGGCIYFQGKEVPNYVANDAPEEEPDLRIRVSLENFEKIVTGEVKAQRLMLTGKIRIKGDIRQAMKLDQTLKLG